MIRDVMEQDLEQIKEIICYYRTQTQYCWDSLLPDDSWMERWLTDHRKMPYCALVAVEDKQVLGYATLSCFRSSPGYNCTAENSIYVCNGREGSGVGSALMQALLARGKSNGLSSITAWIDSTNEESERFHEKFGFRRVGFMERVGEVHNRPASAIIMQTWLDTP